MENMTGRKLINGKKINLSFTMNMGSAVFLALSLLQASCSQNSQSQKVADVTNGSNADLSQLSASASQKIYVDEAELEQIKPHKIECGTPDKEGKARICILICHVPPGNPASAKDSVIPLQALNAHLNHGHASLDHRDYLGSCIKDSSESTEQSGTSQTTDSTLTNDSTQSTDTTQSTSTTPSTDTTQPSSSSQTTDPTQTVDPTQTTDTSMSTNTNQSVDTSQTTASPSSTDSGATTSSSQTTVDSVIPLWCQAYVGIDNNCDGFNDLTGDPLL